MKHFPTYHFFNHQGVCYMSPKHTPTLPSLTQSATLLPQARMLNRDTIHATYGRRICPGIYLGEASLFACIATSLAVFNFEGTVMNGVPIVPVHESTDISGIIRFLLSKLLYA